MEILSAEEIRKADKFTIKNEPISSIDLMERAATNFFHRLNTIIKNERLKPTGFDIVCANGNNGGDALVLARLLSERDIKANVFLIEILETPSPDFASNLKRLTESNVSVKSIELNGDGLLLTEGSIIVDGIFGSGLNRSIEGELGRVIDKINNSGRTIFSIDMPSGLFADKSSVGNTMIRANYTLSFEYPKLAFFLPECQEYLGKWEIIPIGLSKEFLKKSDINKVVIDADLIKTFFRKRQRFSHKGSYGHALICAGSNGKVGAAILCARAAMRSGLGLLTVLSLSDARTALNATVPEAMLLNESDFTSELQDGFKKFQSIGIGPGISTKKEAALTFTRILDSVDNPTVIDADAINLLSKNKDWLKLIAKGSILTPHPKEFERLVGKWDNEFERLDKLVEFAKKYALTMVLKDAYTCIVNSSGKIYFNLIGNAGMATGGSGDVLTGIITGLLAQGYSPEQSAVLGVYVHALAGDLAVEKVSQTGMIAGDIIDNLGAAFKTFE